MSENPSGKGEALLSYPIGTIRRSDEGIHLEILEPYRPAMKELAHFSHVMVFWWAHYLDDDEHRSIMQCEPPYASGHVTGMFATRSPVRPNPIMMTTCKVLAVDEARGIVRVADIDAMDDTPIVDLKAYIQVCDRVENVRIPEWLSDWPEWMPENGNGLEEYDLLD